MCSGKLAKSFEDSVAKQGLPLQSALGLLNTTMYFDLLGIPYPQTLDAVASYYLDEHLLVKEKNGFYSITNLGALLFAKKLNDFPSVARKAIRIAQYKDINRLQLMKDEVFTTGYVLGIEWALKYIDALVPSREVITFALRNRKSAYSSLSIRKGLLNSLVYQDLSVTGSGPTVEIFSNRIEFTNPGLPLMGNPLKLHNERLVPLMKKLHFYDGIGEDLNSTDGEQSPASKIELYRDSIRVTLFSAER